MTPAGGVPELPAQPPLLSGSLLLPEAVDLQGDGDEQLEERRRSKQPVAVFDGVVASSEPGHVQLHTHTHSNYHKTNSQTNCFPSFTAVQ